MTEQALYYSYFKDAVDPGVSFLDAVHRYIHDDSVEYPSVVNALKVHARRSNRNRNRNHAIICIAPRSLAI
jgi:hypothetical protein